MGSTANRPADLLQGTLELLILRTLAPGEKHGYEIAEADPHGLGHRALGRGRRALPGVAPPGSARAADRVVGRVGQQPAREVPTRLTSEGRKRLKETTEAWRRTSVAINRVLEAV